MWPWSTIRQLKADAAMWERQYHKAYELWEGARKRESEAIRLAQESDLRLANAGLRLQLTATAKNNTRDAKGRFVKAPVS